MKKTFLLFLILSNTLVAQDISVKNIKKHISFLASDKLKGRGTGSAEELKAAQYIAKQFKKIGLDAKGNDGFLHRYEFTKPQNPHEMDNPNAPKIKTQNVVGYLDNGAEFTIIVGAHYDHLGLGHDKNSLDANPVGKIHNGADDNASGTSGVIELARYFVENGRKEPFNFLFICFSAEELGLFGSKKYIENPTINLDKANYMVNMDMIGRYRDDKGLIVQGIGTCPLWGKMLEVVKTDLKIITDSSGIGPSDYTSFYLRQMPVLGFFTGAHNDYHRPSDDVATINFEGEVAVLNYVARIIEGTCTFPKLQFTPTKTTEKKGKAFKVSLGVIPDYAYDKKGMRIDGVTEGKPAAAAGLLQNDVIVKLGDNEVNDVYGYMEALSKFQKGDKTQVTVKRKEETLTFDITF